MYIFVAAKVKVKQVPYMLITLYQRSNKDAFYRTDDTPILYFQVILKVFLDDAETRVSEVPLTPATTCGDVIAYCKEPGEEECHLAELWRGCGKAHERYSILYNKACLFCLIISTPVEFYQDNMCYVVSLNIEYIAIQE